MSPIKVSPIIIAPESLLLHDKNRNLPFFLTIQIEFNLKVPITLAGLNFPVTRTNSKRPFLFGRSFECCLSKSHLLSMHPNPCYYMMRIWIWPSIFFINSNWIQPESFHFIGRPYFVHIWPNFSSQELDKWQNIIIYLEVILNVSYQSDTYC